MNQNTKSILITGSTSGIGYYTAKMFAQRGWIVWAGYRYVVGRDKLSKLRIHNIHPIRVDVTSITSITKAYTVISKSHIPLKVLYNNAGVAFGGPIELLSMPELKKAFDINFFGPVRMIQTFLPLLRKYSGRIVNISSVSGLVGIPFEVPTSAPKYALEGMSDALRRELENQNIHVSIIEPVIIRTEIWQKSLNLSYKLLQQQESKFRIYKKAADRMSHFFEHNVNVFMPLSLLDKTLLHAIESRYPKNRYLVYRHGYLLKLIITFMPEKLMDLFFRKALWF